MRTRLAWTLFALTCGLAVIEVSLLAIAMGAWSAGLLFAHGFPFVTVATVLSAGIGALIVSRYPRHRVGWLFVAGGLGTQLGTTAEVYAVMADDTGFGSPIVAQYMMWFAALSGAVFALVLAILFLLVPDGHLLSPRWRWAVYVTVGGMALHGAALLTVPPDEVLFDEEMELGLATQIMETSSVLAVLSGLVSGTVSLVLRMRRSVGDERQQLRWIASGAVALLAGLILILVGDLFGGSVYVVLPLMIGYACVPVFTGVAILRFRLYDLDIIISRAIVLAVLTVFVAVGYVALVVVISRFVDAPAEGMFWPSLLATALVALAFQPLRGRVTQLADRAVYGAQAAPYEELATFIRGLQQSPSAEGLLPRVAEAAARAVGARQATIWIDVPAARSCWPDDAGGSGDVVLPVVDRGEQLGGLALAMPRGRSLRRAEQRLLRDFAGQLGLSFRNLRLEADLAERVTQVAHRTEDLVASRRRLVSAQAAERQRLEAAIRRDVLPHLQGLPAELSGMRVAAQRGGWDPGEIDRLVADANAALEALRTLTRGVFPAQLAHRGLVAALTTHLVSAGLDAPRLSPAVCGRRFSPKVESAAYFCCVESLRELGRPAWVALDVVDGALTVTIAGQGTGEDWQHLTDRVEAVGGTAGHTSRDGTVTVLVAIPVDSAAGGEPGGRQAAGAEI